MEQTDWLGWFILARYAILENSLVINVIIADEDFIKEYKLNAVKCDDEIHPGWKFIDKEFIAPPVIYGPVENVEE